MSKKLLTLSQENLAEIHEKYRESIQEKPVECDNVYDLGALISRNLNGGFLHSAFKAGANLGLYMICEHRTLQGLFINLLLGAIYGMSYAKEIEATDARNEVGVESCAKIAEMIDNGDIELNPYI